MQFTEVAKPREPSLTEAMQPFNQFMAQMPKRTESGAIFR